jgi:hypothetical protein
MIAEFGKKLVFRKEGRIFAIVFVCLLPPISAPSAASAFFL